MESGQLKNCNNEYKNKTIKFFTQFISEEKITIPSQKPDLEDIISVIVDPQIISLRVINTPIGISYEGQKLTGKKVSIEIKLKQKVMYISKSINQSVHVVENEYLNSVYIVVPNLILGSKIEDLIRCKYLMPSVTLEGVTTQKIDERTIFKNVILFIELKMCATYLICNSENYKCRNSKVYISYADGTHKKEIVEVDGYKVSKLKWSISGQRVAYICYNKHTSILCMASISGSLRREITDSDKFRYVEDFEWGKDDRSIFFSAYLKEKKEIFVADLNDCEWRRLTYSNCKCSNDNPKVSNDGNKLGYIKKIGECSNIYIMNLDGLETKKVTSLDNIKCFDWKQDNLGIICVGRNNKNCQNNYNSCLGDGSGDEIFIIDILSCNEMILGVSNANLNIRNIKIAPNGRYVAFVGRLIEIDNIYIYDLLKQKLINTTNNEFNLKISDFDWSSDSTQIYFSCNELDYYNVYYVVISNKRINQISNTKADNIKLSYRPRII